MNDDEKVLHATQQVAARLLQQQQRLVTAESCTGGGLAKVLTDLPGSSAWYECGYVTYSNAAKQRDLRVDDKILAEHGAVSRAVALAMARGALQVSGATLSLAITGIAGPSGGSKEKPVGTVWFAWATARDATATVQQFAGERDAVRRAAVHFALQQLCVIQFSA
jgi:nicotinamide-nucleotide amidase